MERPNTPPSILIGAWLGLLLTAPLLAVFFLGERLLRLPLVPLDLFDFMVPLIPGGLIAFVIGAMVDTIIALGFGSDVDSIAKTIEQGIGFITLLGAGFALGGLAYGVMRSVRQSPPLLGGIIGAVWGMFLMSVSLNSPFLATPAWIAGGWVLALLTVWGASLGWIYNDLAQMSSAFDPSIDAEIVPRVEQIGRRDFLIRIGGTAATLTVIGAGLGLMFSDDGAPAQPVAANPTAAPQPDGTPAPTAQSVAGGRLPNADDPVQPAPGMRPEYTPISEHYRIDIATRPIEIDGATWTLPFTGLIATERAFTMAQLQSYPASEQYITMQCISNRLGGSLISTTKWTGVPVRDILNELDLAPDAAYLRIDGADNFFEYLSIDMAMNDERVMFCYAWDDQPLPARNGFPLRVYIPDLYGMKQPKWITGITVVSADERGYWVRRGWSQTAQMQTTSVIDTVATQAIYTDDDGITRVPMGGYAVAGARGISKVEVSINEGEWTEALLRRPLSDTTWTFWRYDWAFEEGTHEIRVRTYDADGNLQPTQEQDVRPDGATGIHSYTARL